MYSHDVSAVSSSCQVKGWERHLVLCQELSRSQAVSQRRFRNNPAITALAMSRYSKIAGAYWNNLKLHLTLCFILFQNRYSSVRIFSPTLTHIICVLLHALQQNTWPIWNNFHIIEAPSLLCRSHATLLAGDAWGRVFTWTCEWEVSGFEHSLVPPATISTHPLSSQRLWHRKSISVWQQLSIETRCVNVCIQGELCYNIWYIQML